jgi:hypothetical protein
VRSFVVRSKVAAAAAAAAAASSSVMSLTDLELSPRKSLTPEDLKNMNWSSQVTGARTQHRRQPSYTRAVTAILSPPGAVGAPTAEPPFMRHITSRTSLLELDLDMMGSRDNLSLLQTSGSVLLNDAILMGNEGHLGHASHLDKKSSSRRTTEASDSRDQSAGEQSESEHVHQPRDDHHHAPRRFTLAHLMHLDSVCWWLFTARRRAQLIDGNNPYAFWWLSCGRLVLASAMLFGLLAGLIAVLVPCAVFTEAERNFCYSIVSKVNRHTNCGVDWSLPLTEEQAQRAISCDHEQCDEPRRGDPVAVFWAGYNDTACFRIPTVITSHTGTLLAFAEARLTSCSDDTDHKLVLRRSLDGGTTWGDLIVAVDGIVPCEGCPASVSNANPVAVWLQGGRAAILLHFNTLNNPTQLVHGVAMQIWSFDDGLTWEGASVLTYPPVHNIGGLIGPSVGLQADDGTIFFSARQPERGTFLYWSSDFGASWRASELVPTDEFGLDECSIAWLRNSSDGEILMNCRTRLNERALMTWTADGLPGRVTYPGLTDENCQGSLLNAGGAHFLSHINSRWERAHLQIHRSIDGGKNWTEVRKVRRGAAAYSQLIELGAAPRGGGIRLGIIFEGGTWCPYEVIGFWQFTFRESAARRTTLSVDSPA